MYIINGKKYPTTAAAKQSLGIDVDQSLPSDIEQIESVIPAHDPKLQYADWDYNDDGSVNGIVILPVQQYARLQQNVVVDINPNPADGWIVIPAQLNPYIALGWRLENGAFEPPGGVPTYLARRRQYALAAIAEKHAEMLVTATGGATPVERDTWIVKERDANAVIFDGATASDSLIPVAGETLIELASKVAMKSTLFRQLVGIVDNIKRTAEKAVEALPLESLDDLAALEAVLADAKAMADNAFKQLTTGR